MSFKIDHNRRRISVTAGPDLSGEAISKAVARMILADARTASYDFVLDVRNSATGSTVADFQIVLNAYRATPRTPDLKYGCYVSVDPNYKLWAVSMGQLFGDRDCPVFTTPEEAHAFLDAKRCAA